LGTLLALVVLAGTTPAPAGAAIVSAPHGARFGVQSVSAVTVPQLTGASRRGRVEMGAFDTGHADGNVSYHGGPVLHGFTSYAFFWDPNNAFTARTKSMLTGYLTNTAHDSGTSNNIFSVVSQYGDSAGDAAYAQTFGGAITDTQPYPTSGGCKQTTPSATTCLYNAQELAALHSYIKSHGLPTGLGAVYVIFTPDTVVNCMADGSECSDNDYCSFHSFSGKGSSTILYIEIPFTLLDDASDAKSCQDDGSGVVQSPNGDPGFSDVALKALSHEEIETISDPLLDAWYAGDGDEVADMCNDVTSNANSFLPTEGGDAQSGTLYNQTINGAHYYLQGVWSNVTSACAMSLLPGLDPAISLPAAPAAGTPATFSGTSGTGVASGSRCVWAFGPDEHASGQNVRHTFALPGTYDVELTVTDASGDTGATSVQIIVAGGGTTAGASGKRKRTGRGATTTRCKVHKGRHHATTRACSHTNRPDSSATTVMLTPTKAKHNKHH
jgi:hypothetical protein